MNNQAITKTSKTPSFGVALLPLIFMVVVLITGIIFLKIDIKVLLVIAATFTTIQALILGHTWKDIEKEAISKLAKAFPAVLILIFVGFMIGTWIVSGTIPYLVYMGLQIISPKYIVITSFLVTVILSVSTGTSWGAVGTVGAALMSVAAGMGAPLAAVAGAIVSGAYFGDKMSPLSDSTNMSAIATNTNLYQHIGHMFYTTIPGFIVCCIVYVIAGLSFASEGSINEVDMIVQNLNQLFNFSSVSVALILLPPVIVLVGSVKKLPTIPVMITSAMFSIILAMTLQGFSLDAVTSSVVSGFKMEMFVNPVVDLTTIPQQIPKLLQRGGMVSMMNSVLTAYCAFIFIGALSVSGSLDVILPRVMKGIKSTGNLVATTVVTGVSTITIIGEATISFLMIGGLFREEYVKRGLATKNLSRTLEDSITVIEPIVPWSLAGIYMASNLGVSTIEYAPWACLCYTGAIFAVIWGYTGVGIAKLKKGEDGYDEYLKLNQENEADQTILEVDGIILNQ
ncbi:MAG: Na+/H+ antiporter NhaC [Clostridium sp.]